MLNSTEMNISSASSKKSPYEIEKLIENLEKEIPKPLRTQTFPCYTGNLEEIDPLTRRPVGFVGPLEHEVLPESRVRRVMWLAALCFTKERFCDFIVTLPGIKIQKKVDTPEKMVFPGTSVATFRNCFDEAFENNEYYQKMSRNVGCYGIMTFQAFENRNPGSLLNKMGYTEVQKGKVGDIVVYFSNAAFDTKFVENPFPSFREKKKPAHYGIIVDVKENEIVVQSRFNDYHVYQHGIGAIPYFWGSGFLFYSNQKPL